MTWQSRGRRSGRRGFGEPTEPGDDRLADADADPEDVAREIVLRKLTAQARTRSELRKALDQRQVPAEASEAVLDRMEEVGLVDDAAFAEAWVTSRQQRRHLSKRALRQELQRKGVAGDTVSSVLEGLDSDDEIAAATALAEKKLRSLRGVEPLVRQRRLAGALARRGFSGQVTAAVLERFADEIAGRD